MGQLRVNHKGLKRPNPHSVTIDVNIRAFDALFRKSISSRVTKFLYNEADFPISYFPRGWDVLLGGYADMFV